MTRSELFARYPQTDSAAVEQALALELAKSSAKVIALDDDPTGIQTVHDVFVYTGWDQDSIRQAVQDGNRLSFILTNSRAFDSSKTETEHRIMAENILANSKDFILISRGDSTLRGHYPLETQVLHDTMKEHGMAPDGEIIYPFFPEGGRFTAENIHYVLIGEELVPAGETEFAKDKTFGYHSSDLTQWIEEKTGGAYPANKVVCITLEELRNRDYESIERKLLAVEDFGKVIVNSLCYDDVKVFVTACLRAMAKGKRFLFRSAAAVVKVLGGVSDRPILEAGELRARDNPNGGLIIVGSHVKKTTDQLEALRTRKDILFVEMNQHLVTDKAAFEAEVQRVISETRQAVQNGRTVAVYTRRDRFDLGFGNKEDELRLSTLISDKVTSIVEELGVRPSFLIAKGGITSSDVGTKGLGVKKATVLGQILPGVPVWLTGPESRFPDMPYVIFPGNVGDENSLLAAVEKFL